MTEYIEGVDANRFRRKRFAQFMALANAIAETKATVRVIDLGGTPAYWTAMAGLWASTPLDITIVNLGSEASDDGPIHIRPGNACSLPEYADNSFDIVHSNSVIEHVGHWVEMTSMANEVRRLAPRYYVQTPNFWFPMEPHYRTLLFQMWPEAVRAKMLMRKRRGFRGPYTDLSAAMRDVQTVELLNKEQMAALFPDAQIHHEKIFGLSKSLIAIR
jgi:hypothetical protein